MENNSSIPDELARAKEDHVDPQHGLNSGQSNLVSWFLSEETASEFPKIGKGSQTTCSLSVNVQNVMQDLLRTQDTDGDKRITTNDSGSGTFRLTGDSSSGPLSVNINGTYRLWSLLDFLARAREQGQRTAIVNLAYLDEDPVSRLERAIKDRFWTNLTRRLDESSLVKALAEGKEATEGQVYRIYIPPGAMAQYEYYRSVAAKSPNLRIEVELLPKVMTHDLYRRLNQFPGLLALDVESISIEGSEAPTLRGLPYIVPGGRFNELYNWDSYFIALGLLRDGRVDLVEPLVKNFIFQIQHYGLIPNANRSYYLLRSQPPFLTDLALRLYRLTSNNTGSKQLLRNAIAAAIKEYHTVWMSEPRWDAQTKLSRYRPDGIASPPECTTGHFAAVLQPFADKYNKSVSELRELYDLGQISEPELDNYFLHDRAVRESGHDVSSRTERVCADLATVDLNSLLYKFETDIEHVISEIFDGDFSVPSEYHFQSQDVQLDQRADVWRERARIRKESVNQYLWNEQLGSFCDYNTATKEYGKVEGVTCLWPLWSGLASPQQASRAVRHAFDRFEFSGGLSCTPSPGLNNDVQPQEKYQWDYPYGWAPHQMLAWYGLVNYGFKSDAQRLAYKWLWLILKTFVDHNGCVAEKYNVVRVSDAHKVTADYGNQGINFEYYCKEGFGWTNASFVCGLDILSQGQRRALSSLVPWSDLQNQAA